MKWDKNINWDNPDILKLDSRLWEYLKAETDDDTFIPLNLNSSNIPEGFIKQFLILTSPIAIVSSAVNGIIPGITLNIWSLNAQ